VCAKYLKQDEVAGFVKLGIADDNRGRASPLGGPRDPHPPSGRATRLARRMTWLRNIYDPKSRNSKDLIGTLSPRIVQL